jgi:hypothetical protein
MPGQLQELRRGDISVDLLRTHTQQYTSILLDMSISFDVLLGVGLSGGPNPA